MTATSTEVVTSTGVTVTAGAAFAETTSTEALVTEPADSSTGDDDAVESMSMTIPESDDEAASDDLPPVSNNYDEHDNHATWPFF